jgi:hypothetical protein
VTKKEGDERDELTGRRRNRRRRNRRRNRRRYYILMCEFVISRLYS